MTIEEIAILSDEGVRAAIGENIGRNPAAVALDKRVPHAALVATQVKYLQRARTKLPSYYAARCILPPLAFEQSSSEQAAAAKEYTGALAIDLTCGLGVDSLALAGRFTRVVAIERDPVLACVARANFRLLGADNIEVVNSSAEEYLAANPHPGADLVYLDPARRSDSGRKTVVLADCSPDAGALLPALREAGRQVVVKLSPLFDVDEAFRIFGEHTRVEVVSTGGECKEVLVETCDDIPHPVIAARPLEYGSVEYPHGTARTAGSTTETPATEAQWLIAPDVALVKARIARRWFTENGCRIDSDNSYAFASTLPERFPGRAYRIVRSLPYSPKTLKKALRAEGIRSLTVLKRNFPYATADILKQLGVKEGGGLIAAFTLANGAPMVFVVEQL